MPKTRLTTAAVERLRAPQTGQIEYFDAHLPAFGIRIAYSGTKSWFVTTRVRGKLTRITLGRFPTLSLAEAREKARISIEKAKAGGDPRQGGVEAAHPGSLQRPTTFKGTADLFMQQHVERNLRPNTSREYRRILQGNDTRTWHARPIGEISKADVLNLLHRLGARGSYTAANRALAYLSKFFNWCIEQDYLTVSPTTKVKTLTPNRSRDRVLKPEEIAWVWKALDDISGPFAPAFKLLLLTGQRRGEVGGMHWSELQNLGTQQAIWEIPASRTKNRQAHLVPLTPEVEAILTSQPRIGPLVFTNRSTKSLSGFSKAKALLDDKITAIRAELGLPPLLPWTLHDLRRTMVTMMNEQIGTAPHIVEAAVNHISGPSKRGVAGVYNRALYLAERRQALAEWTQFVLEVSRPDQLQDLKA